MERQWEIECVDDGMRQETLSWARFLFSFTFLPLFSSTN